MRTLHLMTQRDQPYGSFRKCCEQCGLMMIGRPDEFWAGHEWTDDPSEYENVDATKFRRCLLQPSEPANTRIQRPGTGPLE